MKFSVIGSLPSALPLLTEVHQSSEHQLGPCWVAGKLEDRLSALQIPLTRENSPENAFLAPGVDAVIIAVEDTEEVLRLTRSAAQSERHVVIVVPQDVSTAFSFELHLLFDESDRCVIPLIGRMRLATLPADRISFFDHVSESDPGLRDAVGVQQLILEVGGLNSSPEDWQSSQLEALDCLGACGLLYTQVTAIEAAGMDGKLISRLVTLGAAPTSEQRLPPATISLKAGPQQTDGIYGRELQVIRDDGTVSRHQLLSVPPVLPRISWLCQHREACGRWMDAFSASLELTDAISKSLRRRRTVDVYFDTGSERGVFKSQMTAIGCGVLTWMIVGMIGFLIVAQLTALSPKVLMIGRALWIAPLVLFLAAQLLLPLTRSRPKSP